MQSRNNLDGLVMDECPGGVLRGQEEATDDNAAKLSSFQELISLERVECCAGF